MRFFEVQIELVRLCDGALVPDRFETDVVFRIVDSEAYALIARVIEDVKHRAKEYDW